MFFLLSLFTSLLFPTFSRHYYYLKNLSHFCEKNFCVLQLRLRVKPPMKKCWGICQQQVIYSIALLLGSIHREVWPSLLSFVIFLLTNVLGLQQVCPPGWFKEQVFNAIAVTAETCRYASLKVRWAPCHHGLCCSWFVFFLENGSNPLDNFIEALGQSVVVSWSCWQFFNYVRHVLAGEKYDILWKTQDCSIITFIAGFNVLRSSCVFFWEGCR